MSIGSLYARRTVVFPAALKLMEGSATEYPNSINQPTEKTYDSSTAAQTATSKRQTKKTRKPDIQIYVPRGRRLYQNENCVKQARTFCPPKKSTADCVIDLTNQPEQESSVDDVIDITSQPAQISTDCMIDLTNKPEKCTRDNVFTYTEIVTSQADDSISSKKKTEIDSSSMENSDSAISEMPTKKRLKDYDQLSVKTVVETCDSSDSLLTVSLSRKNDAPIYESKTDVNLSDTISDNIICIKSVISKQLTVDVTDSIAKDTLVSSDINVEGNIENEKGNDCVEKNPYFRHFEKKEEIKDAAVDMTAPSNLITNWNRNQAVPDTTLKSDSSTKVGEKKLDECDWEELYNEDGEFLDKNLFDELMNAIGKVSVQKATQDYRPFQTVEERSSDGECIIEIHDFDHNVKTEDLLCIFAPYRGNGEFQIVWVDDTHALAVFSSPLIADEVLNTKLPFVKTRPLKDAIPKSKMIAQGHVLPPATRPKTCVSLARRLVSGHLGMKIKVTDKQQEAEKKLLSDAREQKRLIARQKLEAWEGSPS